MLQGMDHPLKYTCLGQALLDTQRLIPFECYRNQPVNDNNYFCSRLSLQLSDIMSGWGALALKTQSRDTGLLFTGEQCAPCRNTCELGSALTACFPDCLLQHSCESAIRQSNHVWVFFSVLCPFMNLASWQQ